MKWFKEVFLPSFAECKDRCITEKQADIFMKYLKNIKEDDCATTYSDVIEHKRITLQDSLEWAGYKTLKHKYYLTIQEA